jgi:hypothetical protein
MNKLIMITTALLVLCVVAPLSAQKAYIGVIGGVNIADLNIDSDEVDDIETINTMSFGGIFGLRLRENIFLQLEPKYLVKGGTLTDPEGEIEIEMKTKYLEVPVLVKAVFGQNRFHVLAGPTLGYMFSSELEAKISGFTFSGDGEDILKNTDLGIVVGAGINFPISKGNLFLDGRYSHGLLKQAKDGNAELESDGIVIDIMAEKENDLINKGFQIMLGYTFPLNWK